MSRRRGVRRGEKVPTAGGTVADRVVGLDGLAGLDDEGSGVGGPRAEASAGRAGELVGQVVGLAVEEGGEGALGQSVGGGLGDGLQGTEVKRGCGPVVGGDPAGDDFSPLAGQITEFLEVLG